MNEYDKIFMVNNELNKTTDKIINNINNLIKKYDGVDYGFYE